MPIEILNGSAYVPVKPDGATRVELFDGSQYRLIWEALVTHRDDFSTDRTDGWGPLWASQSNPPGRVQDGVAVNKNVTSGQANQWVVGRFTGLPSTNDVKLKVKVVKPPQQRQAEDMEMLFALRAGTTWQSGKAVWFSIYPGSCAIHSADGASFTTRASGGAIPVGSELEMTARGNHYMIRNLTTDTTLVEWLDKDVVVPVTEANRSMWMFQKGNYPIFQSAYGSYAADWLEYGDVSVPAPVGSSVSPSSIFSSGGTVTVNGSNFFTKPLAKVDGTYLPLTAVNWISATQVGVTIPALAAGARNLTLEFEHGAVTLPFTAILDARKAVGMQRPASPSFDIHTNNLPMYVDGWAPHASYPDSDVEAYSVLIEGSGLYNINGVMVLSNGTSVGTTLLKDYDEIQHIASGNTRTFSAQNYYLEAGQRIQFAVIKTTTASRAVNQANLTIVPSA